MIPLGRAKGSLGASSGNPKLVGGDWLPFFYFPIYWVAIIIPIDVHIFQRGGPTTNQQENGENGGCEKLGFHMLKWG